MAQTAPPNMSETYVGGVRLDASRTILIRFDPEFTKTREPVELEATHAQIKNMIAELESAARVLEQP